MTVFVGPPWADCFTTLQDYSTTVNARRLTCSALSEACPALVAGLSLVMTSLATLNPHNAKYASWAVRVLHARVERYTFTARGEPVEASRFVCLLVSEDPLTRCVGNVKFSFRDKQAAEKAAEKFREGTAWLLRTPVLDTQMQPKYEGASVKVVVLLSGQTQCAAILAGSSQEKALSRWVEPPLKLRDIVELQDQQRVDFVALLKSVEEPRECTVAGSTVTVCTAVLVDIRDGDAVEASVSVWGALTRTVQTLVGRAVLVLNLGASRERDQLRLNAREGVCRFSLCETAEGQSIEAAFRDLSQEPTSVTASWVPSTMSTEGIAGISKRIAAMLMYSGAYASNCKLYIACSCLS